MWGMMVVWFILLEMHQARGEYRPWLAWLLFMWAIVLTLAHSVGGFTLLFQVSNLCTRYTTEVCHLLVHIIHYPSDPLRLPGGHSILFIVSPSETTQLRGALSTVQVVSNLHSDRLWCMGMELCVSIHHPNFDYAH